MLEKALLSSVSLSLIARVVVGREVSTCGQLGTGGNTLTPVQQTAMLTVSIPLLLALLIRTVALPITTRRALPKWPSLSAITQQLSLHQENHGRRMIKCTPRRWVGNAPKVSLEQVLQLH